MADEITPIEVKEDCLISSFGDLFLQAKFLGCNSEQKDRCN
jgi:hypothetical protein